MATNEEQIQANLSLVKYVFWEPRSISDIQFSISDLQALDAKLTAHAAGITAVQTALIDIEDNATDPNTTDLQWTITYQSSSDFVWWSAANDSGVVAFYLNETSSFYTDYVVPNVSSTDVPTEVDGVPVNESTLKINRQQALRADPMLVITTTLLAITALQAVVQAKIANLQATYGG